MQGEIDPALLPVYAQKEQDKQRIAELQKFLKSDPSDQIDDIVMKYIF